MWGRNVVPGLEKLAWGRGSAPYQRVGVGKPLTVPASQLPCL